MQRFAGNIDKTVLKFEKLQYNEKKSKHKIRSRAWLNGLYWWTTPKLY